MFSSDKATERHLLITLRSQPMHQRFVQERLLDLVSLIQSEPGCLSYQRFQQADDPAMFVVEAAWDSDEAVVAYPTPPQARLVEQIMPLLAMPMQVLPLRRLSESP